MKVLFLTNNDNTRPLSDWLNEREDVILCDQRCTCELLESLQPEIIISFNYQYIISKEVINSFPGDIINLHISLLPWNKGADPNIWSFMNDTPKGVTIHKLEEGLDTGAVLFQRELLFDENVESLSSSYNTLISNITDLFMEHWEEIKSSNYKVIPQIPHAGSYHRRADLDEVLDRKLIDYDSTIASFKELLNGKR